VLLRVILLLLLGLALATPGLSGPAFIPLGDLPGGNSSSFAYGVSAEARPWSGTVLACPAERLPRRLSFSAGVDRSSLHGRKMPA
jgi:hypothetical protein